MPEKLPLATISTSTEADITDRRSRFLCTLQHVSSVEEAQNVIANVRQRDWDARHHCTAMILGIDGEVVRSNDDGEPAGTAGAPMLSALRSAEVSDVVAVVTRWFGGVLLGTGGLVRAYTDAVNAALAKAHRVERRRMTVRKFQVSAADVGKVENSLRTWVKISSAVLAHVSYGQVATFEVHFELNYLDSFEMWRNQNAIDVVEDLGVVVSKVG